MPAERHQQTDPDGLTARERLFVEAFFINPEPAEAHRKAGYTAGKDSNRATLGGQVLVRPKVQAALAKLRAKRAIETDITAARVLKEIALVAFSDAGKTNKMAYSDKLKALDMLAKHLGIFDKKQGSPEDFREWLERLDRL